MSGESGGGHAQRGREDGPAPGARTAAEDELTRVLAPAVAEAGFDLEQIDVRPAGRRRLVKIVVDSDDGVSLDDVTLISRTASALLDGSDVMGTGPYVLEVTSPGVDRPLVEPRHWRRAAGRLVVAPLAAGGQVEGRVVSADDESVVIDVTGPAKGGRGAKGAKAPKGVPKKATRRRFGLDELGRGRVQVEFRRDGDPGEPAGEAAEERSPAEPD
jgi:ribosome maturation factor RimP